MGGCVWFSTAVDPFTLHSAQILTDGPKTSPTARTWTGSWSFGPFRKSRKPDQLKDPSLSGRHTGLMEVSGVGVWVRRASPVPDTPITCTSQ